MKPNYPEVNRLLLITILCLIRRNNQEPRIIKIDRQKVLLACCFFLWGFSYNLNQVQAQIVPDATVNSIVTPTGKANVIEGGTRAGNNLFHSFREFSVPTGGEAFFNNAIDIRNIFSRVTGKSISNIDGLIKANGVANLFLLNPNGIIFGPNAKLNIGGSFFASTANSIKFTDGLEFATNNLQSSPLLSINVPIGLQYGKTPGEIRIQGNSTSSLEVLPGKNLTIIGGNVTINGGILKAPSGQIELGGISTKGTVGFNENGSLSLPDNLARADVSIINQAQIETQSSGGGSITVKARNLDISGESLLLAGITKGKSTPESVAGDILLDATDAITISSSQVNNTVEENAIGNSNTITVNAKSLTLTNGGVLNVSTSGKGKAGNIKILTTDSLSLEGENGETASGIFASVQPKGEGEAGDINITTNSLTITKGAQIAASTFSFGKAGEITIQANSISLDGEGSSSYSSIISSVGKNGIGDGSGITINTKTLTLTNGALLNASTLGIGKAGKIRINASDSVSFDGEASDGTSTGAFGFVGENAEGEANGIEINTKSLTLTNGAQINANTLGKGKAGDIKIVASDRISLEGKGSNFVSGIFATVESKGEGEAGNINITTNSLTITNGAQINASTFGKGKAGDIKIIASDRISLDSKNSNSISGIFAHVQQNGEGKAGDINITTNSLTIANGAQIAAATFGFGKAGEITIQANDISLDGEGKGKQSYSSIVSSVQEGGIGDGSGITINTKTLTLTNGALLNASTLGKGKAGKIRINASESVSFDGEASNGTSTGAFGFVGENAEGEANGIEINTKSLTLTNGAQINANTFGKGKAGDIKIVASDRISLDGEGNNFVSGIFATVESKGEGEAGNINITTDSLTITNGAQIAASTFGFGKAGEITIQANSIFLDGEGKGKQSYSSIMSSVEEGGIGDGRGITINTKTLTVTNGALLNASTSGKGKAGKITINASDSVSFDGEANDRTPTGAFGYVDENAEGEANDITITTNSLTLTNGARIDASTLGIGKAGSITVKANTINLDGETEAGSPTEIRSEVGENAIGIAGDINITTNSLFVTNGAQLNASTSGKGEAGQVAITAKNRVLFDGIGVVNNDNVSGAFSIVNAGAEGKAGGVSVTSNSLTISNGAQIGAGTFGEGNAGSVTINTNNFFLNNDGSVSTIVSNQAKGDPGDLNIVAGRLLLDNRSYLTAESEKGAGGNIRIQSRDIQLRRQSQISATSALDAQQGNIDIATRTLALLEASQIRTDADAPNGGSNITIKPIDDFGVAVFVSANSVISASGNLSIEGYIEPQSSDVPQVEVFDATKLVASTCRRREGEQSEFIVTGKGGLPPNPNEPIINDVTWVDFRPINLEESKGKGEQRSRRIEENGKDEIVEAQGWIKNANGEVVLVANTAKAVPHKLIFNSQYCPEQ
ncbi:filamentous hemagglutinin N-terminal domain-containing protein [Floridanema evergladense]|uniref:Filamentous hemagglutinin N-terminal domain-containing protein n=1 Tax=Floridaenema evergladense BLCC-F167 TaxID=3153639 RepID=A0ABV4WIG7_9CYAN